MRTGLMMEHRISVLEIAKRLDVGPLSVYAMLEHGQLPGIRVGHRWIVARSAYLHWEETCGQLQAGQQALRRVI